MNHQMSSIKGFQQTLDFLRKTTIWPQGFWLKGTTERTVTNIFATLLCVWVKVSALALFYSEGSVLITTDIVWFPVTSNHRIVTIWQTNTARQSLWTRGTGCYVSVALVLQVLTYRTMRKSRSLSLDWNTKLTDTCTHAHTHINSVQLAFLSVYRLYTVTSISYTLVARLTDFHVWWMAPSMFRTGY